MPVDIHMYEINCFGAMAKVKDTRVYEYVHGCGFLSADCPLTDVSAFFSSR